MAESEGFLKRPSSFIQVKTTEKDFYDTHNHLDIEDLTRVVISYEIYETSL